MVEALPKMDAEMYGTFRKNEAQQRLSNTRVGCILVVFLMPAGSTLDYFVYHDKLGLFFCLRLLCAAAAAIILAFLFSEASEKWIQPLGVVVPMLPVVSIAGMIALTEGFGSPYYAGLNLVLIAVGSVLNWTVWESLFAVSVTLAIYIAAGIVSAWHQKMPPMGVIFNNFYFLLLMDIIVIVGTFVQERQRLREFSLRFELDKNRKSLEETNRKLVELDRLKSRFFANVSHELRTPLTLLLAPLEVLVKRFQKINDTGALDLVSTMHNNGMRLLKLINDLLELIRLESGRLELKKEPLSMVDFINGLASAVKQMAVDKKVTLETHTDETLPLILADRDKLEKIVLNLLFNALKFTPQHGRVWLRAEKKDAFYLLIVGDTGVGIAEKSLPFVFDRFWQEDGSAKRKFQGVGIGLALVKELTETMGGQVTVESQLGKGTTFTVSLPFEKVELAPDQIVAPAKLPTETEPGHSDEWLANLYRRAEFFPTSSTTKQNVGTTHFARRTKRPLVLVADDEPDMRRFLLSQLEEEYEVVEARDGNEATEKAQSILPDVILLDLMMPYKDGLQVCRELREYAPTVAIP